MRKLLVLLVAIAGLAANRPQAIIPWAYLPFIARPASGGPNVVRNPGFEDDTATGGCVWWDVANFQHTDCPGEVQSPRFWDAWWIAGQNARCEPDPLGQPEMRLANLVVDPYRVRTGEYAAQWFTFYVCHRAGLQQRHIIDPFTVETKTVEASAWAHVWYSNCGDLDLVHYPAALDRNCQVAPGADHRLRIGIDLVGGQDPRSDYIVWSPWYEPYNEWAWMSVRAPVSVSRPVTLFVESDSGPYQFIYQNVYVDDVELRVIP